MSQVHIVHYSFDQTTNYTVRSLDQPQIYIPAVGDEVAVSNGLHECQGEVTALRTKISFAAGTANGGIIYETTVALVSSLSEPLPDEPFDQPDAESDPDGAELQLDHPRAPDAHD